MTQVRTLFRVGAPPSAGRCIAASVLLACKRRRLLARFPRNPPSKANILFLRKRTTYSFTADAICANSA